MRMINQFNKYKRFFWLFVFLIIFLNACAPDFSIQTITSFKQIDFDSIKSPKMLVIFDVDETLIQPVDSYFVNEHTPQGRQFKEKWMLNHPEVKDWDRIASILLEEVQRPLIEPFVITEIKKLQERNIPVIACTAMNTGKVGLHDHLEKWRYNHLKSLGFEGSFSSQHFGLTGFQHHPVFYKGLLATDLEEKGPIIGAFLDKISFRPEKIVMIDDKSAFIRSVKEECFKRHIHFEGYIYGGAKEKEWNQKLIDFQSTYLLTYRHWLSDEEALKKLHINHIAEY